MQTRASILIARPPAETFAFVADPARASKWRTHLVSSHGSSSAIGDRVSQRYSYQGRTAQIELEVTEYDPPERLSYKTEGPVHGRASFQFRPEQWGTRVSASLSANLTGPAALFAGRIEREAEATLRSDLSRLKAALETGA